VYTLLTDTKLKKSLGRRREKVEVISDAHGLNVRLSAAGAVTFFYRYRWEGRPVQLSIGEYPTVSLSQARERRQQFRSWISEGYDPRQQAMLERQAKVEALTVEQAYTYWETYYCKPEGIVKIKANRQSFEKHIRPMLGNAIVNQTTKAHWLKVFDQMGRMVVTGEVLSLMKRAFRFCSNREVISHNPIESLRKSDVGLTPGMKERKLSDEEIKVLWEGLTLLPVSQQLVIKFLLLTGCRTAEIRKSKWDWFDLTEKTWTVPADDYKTGKSIRRALTEPVIALLKEHKKWSVTEHVLTPVNFKGREDKPPSQPQVSDYATQAVEKTLMRPWTLHDLRRTVATRLSELGAPPHVIEKLLGHQMAGVMARYNLHDYLNDQYEWLNIWHQHLSKVIGRPL
jgi:integrase